MCTQIIGCIPRALTTDEQSIGEKVMFVQLLGFCSFVILDNHLVLLDRGNEFRPFAIAPSCDAQPLLRLGPKHTFDPYQPACKNEICVADPIAHKERLIRSIRVQKARHLGQARLECLQMSFSNCAATRGPFLQLSKPGLARPPEILLAARIELDA